MFQKLEITSVQPYQLHFPPELLQAWRDDRLVFFCGAGVSIPSGLPSFESLVKHLAKEVRGIDLDKEQKEGLGKIIQEECIKGNFPIVINFLATRNKDLSRDETYRNRISEVLKSRFKEGNPVPSKLHRLIAESSIAPNGKRLIITTNFDNLLEAEIGKINVSKYPNFPTPVSFICDGGIVKLHGCIDEDYEKLVLEDYKYTEAYAGRNGKANDFILEVLQNYKALFVGYRIADFDVERILKVITENHQSQQKRFFIILPDNEKEEFKRKFIHIMESVEVISFPLKSEKDKQYDGLPEWLEGFIKECKEPVRPISSDATITQDYNTYVPSSPPLAPEHVKAELEQLALKDPNDHATIQDLLAWFEKDNLAVKFFCEVANASWLPVLVDLLKEHFDKLLSHQALPWTKVEHDTWQVMLWLIRHHENTEVLEYILQKGGFLHPQLRHNLSWDKRRQERKGTTEEAIWDILLEGDQLILHQGVMTVAYPLAQQLQGVDDEEELSPILQQKILHILTPKLRVDMTSYEMRKRWRDSDQEEVCSPLTPSSVFDVVLSEYASFGVNDLADALVKRPAWLALLSVPILAHMQKLDGYFNLIDPEISWLDSELTPLHEIAEACADICEQDERYRCIGVALKELVNKRRPFEISVRHVDITPEKDIAEGEFERAWEEETLDTLKIWLNAIDAPQRGIHPANNLEKHLVNTLKASADVYYQKTEALAQSGTHSVVWWRLLLQTCIADATFVPDWERIALLALEIPEPLQKVLLHNLCGVIKKAADDNKHSLALTDALFWQWWNTLLPFAQEREIASEGSNISNASLNHPLGSLAEALIQRLWHESDGKKEAVIKTVWEARLAALLTTSNGLPAALVILAGQMPVMLHFLPEWTTEKLLPCFGWNQTQQAISAIQAWSAFMYNPRLYDSVVEALLPHFLQGITSDKIQAWDSHDRGLCENYVSCIATLWTEGKFSKDEESLLVRALKQHPEYAKFVLEHWRNCLRRRESGGWEQEYLTNALALLVKYKDSLIHGEAICSATAIVLSLNAEELAQYGEELVDSLAGDSGRAHSAEFLCLLDDSTSPSSLAIWNQPRLLLALLVNRVVHGDTRFWHVGRFNSIIEHLKNSGIDKNDPNFIALQRASHN